MARELLGAGTNSAQVFTRDGRTFLMNVPLTSIEWGRSLCGISRPVITVAPAKCTPDLARVHPWAHSLVIFRDEQRVWEGPIRKRVDSKTGLTITASDVLGWTERRPVLANRNVVGAYVRDELAWALTQAYTGDDPNVLSYVQALGGLPTVTADNSVTSAEKYASEVLTSLVASGGRWTALGRSILIWDEAYTLGRLQDLSPEEHLLSDVEVTEDGDLLATDVIARNDDGVRGRAIKDPGGDPTDDFYGRVAQIAASAAVSPAGVTRTAQAVLNRAYPTPITIDVPADAALRPDAPFPMTSLVPGMLVPVQTTTATARTVRGTFMLTDVKVRQASGEAEQVTITLAPPSEAVA